MLKAPIPGQSLTGTPKNAAWERPPQMNKAPEVIAFYMDKLTDEKRMDAMIQMLETQDVSVRDLTEGVLRAGVASGRHSIDLSLMVAPVIHEYIASTADQVGIDYLTGFEEEDAPIDQKKAGQRLAAREAKKGNIPSEAPKVEEDIIILDETPKEKPKGLMTPSK